MSTYTTKQFADKLSDLIQDSKKEIKVLAKEIGVSSGALSKYQNDMAAPGIEAITKIAKYFGVSADYLLGLSPSKTPEFHNFASLTQFHPETVSRLVELSGKGYDGVCFKRYRIAFEYLLQTDCFTDLISVLCEYLDTTIPHEKIDDFDDLYIKLDRSVGKLSKGNLAVVTTGLLSETLMQMANKHIQDAFSNVRKSINEDGGWERYIPSTL